MDVVLSDAPGWMLQQYAVVIVAGEVAGLEVATKLNQFVAAGGQLVLTAGSLRNLPTPVAGLSVAAQPCESLPAGTTVAMAWPQVANVTEPVAFERCPLATLPANASVLASVPTGPLLVRSSLGSGSVVLSATPFAITAQPAVPPPVTSNIDVPMPTPYPLLQHARRALSAVVTTSACVFQVSSSNLTFSVNMRGPKEYTVAVFNSKYAQQPLAITSLAGPIAALTEVAIDRSERQVRRREEKEIMMKER